jgi:sigma-B regulation protein RsbU (phosphoserine phosphatase)
MLALLAIGSVAFQLVSSRDAVRQIWSESQHFSSATLTAWALLFFGHVLTPFACLFLGFYVASIRFWDRRAWLLLAVLISFSVSANGANVHDEVMLWRTPLKHLALAYRSFGLYTFPFWLAIFAIHFPERSDWERRHPSLKWLVLGPIVGVSCWMAVIRTAANETNAASIQAARDIAAWYWFISFYVATAFYLVVLILKLRWAETPDSRRRVRVLLFGIALNLIPLLSLDALARILHVREDNLPAWLQVSVFPLILAFPITIAYVTVVQRALDISVVIRESLQYALARRGVIVLQIIISLVVIVAVAGIAGRATFLQRLLITAGGIAAVLLVEVGANRLALWIDRRFFRETYNAEQILSRLAENVSSMVELGPLLKTVSARIADALHISEIAVFLREQDIYRPAFSLGYSQPEATFNERAVTVRQLSRTREPVPFYQDDPRSWAASLDSAERQKLRELRAQLLLPLARKDELLGFISLGPKSAEAPFSATDIDLLRSVASQTALAIENSRLTSAIAKETAEAEVLHRELAIAHEVQQRLFPQIYPQIQGLEYYGTCRPAREVGGDYYDFLELPNQELGVAIGDVSGKGVPASLLMASLQASLRGQTVSGSLSMDRLMENINRLIYATTPSNRYATFFYSQYDPAVRSLTYVNAGHNAPIVVRKREDGCSSIRLNIGGPPVGLLPGAIYQSAEVSLEPGDVLVLFTDGISESMNNDDEEWGECRLIETVCGTWNRRPEDLVEAIFAAADAFTAGAPQHDDMTLVVLHVL